MAKGDKSILEVVSGVDFKRPQPKQEGGSLEMSPSPSQAKTVKPEQPKVDYNATNPKSISMLDQIEADNNRVLFKDEKIQTLQGDYEKRVKTEQEALLKKYQSQVEANPDKAESLQAEFEAEAMKIAELRSAEFAKVATDMLGQKEYEYLGKDASNLSKLFQNILEGGSNAATKDKQINEITQSVLSTVPEEMRESVQREINGIVMDVAGESDLGSMYLIQKTVTDKMGRLQQAKASIEAKYQEAMANWKDAPAQAISSAYTAGEVMLPTGTSLPKEIQEIQKQRIAINNALNTYEKALKVPTAKSGSGVAAWREAVPDILTVGMAGMIDAVAISSLVSKQEKGNTTEEEDAIIDAYGSLQTLKGMASQEFNAYRRNQSVAGSVAYLEMMLLTGAQGNIARKIGVDVGKKAVEGKIRNTFIKEVTRRGTRAVVEGAVSAGLRTPLAPATYKGIAEASMGDFKIENGQFVVDEATRPSIVKAIAEGGYNSAVDIFSESLGGIVDIPSRWLSRSLTPTVRKAFQSVGLNGLQGEFFEEMAAAAFQGENPFDPELLKDLLVTVPAMVGGMGIIASPSTIANANNRAKRKDLIDTFGRDKITAIRDAIQSKNDDALVSIVNEAGVGLIEGGLTPEQAKKKVANLVEYASLYVAQTTKDEVSGAVESKVEESVGAMPEGLRAQPEATQGELRFEPEIEETTFLTEETPVDVNRAREIEQLAKNEGYEFEIEADSDSNMTSLNILDGEKRKIEPKDLPEGIRTLAAEYTQLMPEDEVAIEQNDVVEPLSPSSDTKVPLTGESALQKGIDKETEGLSGQNVQINVQIEKESPILTDPKRISTEGLPDLDVVASQEAGEALESEIGGDKGVIDDKVRYIPIQEYDTTPTKRSRQIAEQIQENGWIEPLIISYDKKGEPYIVEGQHRAAALRQLGYDKAPVVVIYDKAQLSTPVQHGNVTIPLEGRKKSKSIGDNTDTEVSKIFVGEEYRGKAEIASEQGVARIRWINVNKKEGETGNGKNAYRTLRDQARERGEELISDIYYRRSSDAEAAWQSLVKSGEAVRVGNYYMFADAPNKEQLVETANKLETLRSSKGVPQARLIEGSEGEVFDDLVNLSKEEFYEKYKGEKDVKKLWRDARTINEFINTLSKLNLNSEEGLQLLKDSITFAKDNNLTEKYGDISEVVGTLESEVRRREARASGQAEQDKGGGEAQADSRGGQDGRGEGKTKPLTGEQVVEETAKATTQGEIVPPTKDGEATGTKEGGKKEYRIGQRALKSDKLNQEVKDGLAEKGIDYVPRAVKMVEAEVKELVDLYIGEEGGLQALEGMVYNQFNGLNPDTRTYLSVYIAEQYDKQLREATDIKDIERIKDKYAELIYQGQQDAAQYGRGVRAQRKWQDVLGTHPDFMVRAARKAKAEQLGEELADKKEDVNLIYSTIKDFLKSPEFEKVVSEKVGEEIDKIASKRLTPQGKKKIDNFFDGLKVRTDGRLFDATLGIPIAVWNGSMESIKKAVLLGVNIYDAIAAGVDYINEWHKKKYAAGEIASPQWQEKEYVATMKEKLKPLLKKTSPSVSRKQPSESQTEKIVNKLYEKTSLLTKPQLRKLIRNSIEEWAELGLLSKEQFQNQIARAMGKPHITSKQEMELYELAKSLSDVKNHGDAIDKAAKELIEAEESGVADKDVINQLRNNLDKAVNASRKANFEAQKAARKINEIFAEEGDLWDMIASLIKGNLLTPASLTVNIVANLAMPVVRGPKAVIASMIDLMLSGIAYSYKPIVKRVSAEKHPWLYKQLQKLPSTTRSMRLEDYVRGATFEGAFRRGAKTGVKQLWTGQLPDDIMKREIPRGLDPIKAAMRIVDGMKGRETMTLEQYMTAFMEALPAGYTGEMMFRLLNLGDKPFREAAYNGRLSEIAGQKGLKGAKRSAFMAAPDTDSHNDAMAEAYKAVWQNDNMVSKFINDVSRAFNNKHKNNVILQSEVVKALAKLSITVMAPYVKTPTNIIREAFEYAAPLYSMVRGIESAYKGDRRQSINFFSKAIVGSAISWMAMEMFLNGIITPPPPDDDDKERQMMYAIERPSMVNLSAFQRWLNGEDPTRREGDVIVTYKRYGIPTTVLNAHIKAYAKVDPTELRDVGYFRKQWMVMPMVISSALDESFLSGMNTGLKGLLEGGPAMDNLLLNTSRALSASVYPNTAALVSKTFFDENYIREVRDLSNPDEALKRRVINDFKDRMFMGKQLPTKVSIWGERVERIPSTRINITGKEWMRFAYMMFPVTQAEKAPESTFGVHIWKLYKETKWTNEEDANKLIPSLPSAGTEVGWDKAKMTPQDYEEFQIRVGKRRAYYTEGYVGTEEWDLADAEEKANTLSAYYSKARKEVMAEMFDWTSVKAQSPAAFKTVEKLGLLPFPSKVRKYKDQVFTIEEVRRYNDIATLSYIESITEVADTFEGRTQEQIIERAKGVWDKRLERPKTIVLKEKRVGQK